MTSSRKELDSTVRSYIKILPTYVVRTARRGKMLLRGDGKLTSMLNLRPSQSVESTHDTRGIQWACPMELSTSRLSPDLSRDKK